MAKRKEDRGAVDQAWVKEQIREAIQEHLNPQGWRMVFHWLRTWGLSGTIITVFLGMIALVASVGHIAYSRVGQEAAFQAHTNDRLDGLNDRAQKLTVAIDEIRAQLAKERLRAQAALPQREFQSTLPDLRNAVQAVKQEKIKISPQLIADVQKKLQQVGKTTPDYWPTVSEFVTYRSLIFTADDLRAFESQGACFGPGVIAFNLNLSNCKFVLDNLEAHDLICQHCLVVYSGGPIQRLYNLTFKDCIFDFALPSTPPREGQEVARILLASNNLSSVTIP